MIPPIYFEISSLKSLLKYLAKVKKYLGLIAIYCLITAFDNVKQFSLEGTSWRYYGNGQYDGYIIQFMPKGGIVMNHPADVTPDNDGWVQQGKKLQMWYNDHYVDYRGKIKSPSLIKGRAKNKFGKTWSFELRREATENEKPDSVMVINLTIYQPISQEQ